MADSEFTRDCPAVLPTEQLVLAQDRSVLAQDQSVLVFHLGGRSFAVPGGAVIQVIAMVRLASLPQAGRLIEGYASIHGEIVPVLNASRHLGLPLCAPSLEMSILLVRARGRALGLLVDAVEGALQLVPGQVAGPDAALPEGMQGPAVLAGVIYQKCRAIFLLDPDRLLKPGQFDVLDRAVQSVTAKKAL